MYQLTWINEDGKVSAIQHPSLEVIRILGAGIKLQGFCGRIWYVKKGKITLV